MKIFEITSIDNNKLLGEKDLDPVTLQRVLKFAADRDRSDATSKDLRISYPGTDELIAKARAQAKRDRVTNVPAHAHDKDGVHKQGFKPIKWDWDSEDIPIDMDIDEKGLDKKANTLPDKIKVIDMPTPPQAPTPDTPDGKQENGIRIATTKKGNRSVSGGAGTYIFTPKGKLMLYMTPSMSGYKQTHNLDKKTVTVNFSTSIDGANIKQKATYDMSGKLLSRDSSNVGSGAMSVGVDKDKGASMNYGSLSGKNFKFSSQDPQDVKDKKLAAFKQDGKDVRAAFRQSANKSLKKLGIEPNKPIER